MDTVKDRLEMDGYGFITTDVDNWFQQDFYIYGSRHTPPSPDGLVHIVNSYDEDKKRKCWSERGVHLRHCWEDTPPMQRHNTPAASYPLLSELVHQAMQTLPTELIFVPGSLYVAGVGGEWFRVLRV
jgi:hypothetical protein